MSKKPRPNAYERFWAKVVRTPNGCLLWTAHKDPKGYGRFYDPSKTVGKNHNVCYAHRWAYEEYVGEVPDGLELDHLCHQPACVSPLHLEPVTGRVNILRGVGQGAMNARKTTCKNGHNDWVKVKHGRTCRTCRRKWLADYYRRARNS